MDKVDLKKVYSEHYSGKPGVQSFVDIPPRPYLMVDGAGDPSSEFGPAVQSLYPVAYGLRAMLKETTDTAFVVMPLEALFWADDMESFGTHRMDEWLWTAMICVPEAVTQEMLDAVLASSPTSRPVRLETYHEGRAAQVLYIGPYDDEAETVAAMHAAIADAGFHLR